MIEKYGPEVADIARQISYKLGADVKTIYKNVSGKTFPTEFYS